MNKKYIIIGDLAFLIIWCILMSIRAFYPKNYPPLDKYDIAAILLLWVDIFLVSKYELYKPKKKYILINAVRGLLFGLPFLVILLQVLLRK